MEKHTPDRKETLDLLKEYNQSDSLIKHALAVEGVMKHFAEHFGEDTDRWGNIGLIHDLDYEQFPEQHCSMTAKILRDRGWPEDYIYSVLSHGYGICTDAEPRHIMEKTLYTIDELTGLIAATALMRPSKSVLDMKIKSIKKKWKQKSFAAGVNRDLIAKGAEMLGMELDVVMSMTLEGMKNVASEIGLEGQVQES